MGKKDDVIEVTGTVLEALPNAKFVVQIEEPEMTVTAYLAGKMRMNFIKILPGDKVTVALNTYDLTQGRITYRHK